jgi:antitoxin component of MazEF toxin-antitoxin module
MIPAALQRSTGITEGTEYVIRATEDGALVVETVDAVKRRLRAAAPAGDWDAAAEARQDQAEEETADRRTEDTEQEARER